MQVIANGAHHHLTGVAAYPDAHLQAMCAPHRLRIVAQGCLHGQGGVTGAHGVVLMGNGRPEERHDAIAQHLVHHALEAVHGVHHVVQGRVQEPLRRFGVKALDQLSGIFDIGEQDGDLLALAFEVRTGLQDFLDQIRWGVGKWLPFLAAGRCRRWQGGWSQGCGGISSPEQHFALVVYGELFDLDELTLDVFQIGVIEAKFPLEHPIGYPLLTLQKLDDLCQELKKAHPSPSASSV